MDHDKQAGVGFKQAGQRVRQQRSSGQPEILLGQGSADPRSAAGCDHKDRR